MLFLHTHSHHNPFVLCFFIWNVGLTLYQEKQLQKFNTLYSQHLARLTPIY